jgi:rhodanese-related sulfurtransferase
MKKQISILLLSLSVFVLACQHNVNTSTANNLTQINTSISVDDFEKKISEDKNPQLIDVRTPGEFEQGHLKGALNYDINGSDFENQLSKLDKNKSVLVYCLSGGRSSSAADILEEKGFLEVYNLKGGIMKWTAQEKPIDNGTETAVSLGMSLGEFEKLSLQTEYVLVDFNATWCKPCIKMAPMLQAFTDKHKTNLTLVKIDADENKNLLKEKGIEAVPVLQLFKNGKLIWTHEGEIDEATLVKETKL